MADSLDSTSLQCNDVKVSQIAAGNQPKGKKIPPLVSEFSAVFTAVGSSEQSCCRQAVQRLASPIQCECSWPLSHQSCPAHSKVLRSKTIKGNEHEHKCEISIGIYWEPSVFVKLALNKLYQHRPQTVKTIPVRKSSLSFSNTHR